MRKHTRILSLAMILMLLAGLFAGCKPAETTAPSAAPTDGTQAPAEQPQTQAPAAEVPELIWWTIGTEPKDLATVNTAINDYIRDKVGATVKIQYANWGDYGSKLSTVVQSGEYYDIAFGASIDNYLDLVQKDYFADLSKLIPEQAPQLHEYLPESMWKAMTFNGKLFGVPAYKDSSAAQYWVYDKSLVDKLNIDYQNIIELEDLEPALKAIKDNDPAVSPLPLFSQEGVSGFFKEYDVLIGGNKAMLGVRYDDKTATVVNPFTQPDVMEDLKLVHKWMNEGYINSDAATITEAPKYRPIFSAQGFPGADADWAVSQGYEVVSQKRFGPVYSTSSIQGSFLVVSAGSKYPEQAVKFIELLNVDPVLRNLVAFGIEGTHYEKTGERTIKVLNDGYQAPAYSQGTFFTMYVVDPAPANKWDLVKEQNEQATESPILGFMLDTSKFSTQLAACTSVYDKYFAGIMTGTVDPEVEVPKFNAEMDAAGLQDIITEVQAQVNAFLGK